MYMGAIDLSTPIKLGTPIPSSTGFTVNTAFTSPKTTSVLPAPLSQPARSGWSGFVETLPTLLTAGFQVSLATKIAKINAGRIAQGLPPLTDNQVQAIAPSPGVKVGLSPDVKRMIMFGGVGIGALVLFGMVGTKKRR